MPEFLFAYHGGKAPESPEEADQEMAAWGVWFASMGAAVVIPGNPVKDSHTVTQGAVVKDGGSNPVGGYTVVQANRIETAIELAKGCPIVKDGSGSVEVAEIFEV